MQSPHGRCRGRASLAVASILAVVICGAVLFILLRGDSGPAEKPPPALPAQRENTTPPTGKAEVAQGGEAAKESPAPDAITAVEDATARIRVFGIVADENGAPLAGMYVRWAPAQRQALERWRHDARALGKGSDVAHIADAALREDLSKSLVATTGSDGKYEFKLPGGASLGAVVATGTGYESQVKEVNPPKEAPVLSPDAEMSPVATAAPREFEVNFALKPAGSIAGTVLDRDTRAPAAGMLVVAGVIDPQTPAMMAFVQPDAPSAVVGRDGAYALQGLPIGEYRVVPRTGDTEYVSISSKDGQRVALGKGVDVTGIDFLVSRGGTIFGVVAGPDEQPLANARVQLMPADLLSSSVQGDVETIMMAGTNKHLTGDKGTYELRGLPLGKEYRVLAAKEELASQLSDAVTLTVEHPRAEANVLLTEGFTVAGTVTYPDGSPAPNTEVYVLPSLADPVSRMTAGNRTVSDAAGAFKFEHVSAGELRLRAGPLSPMAVLTQEGTKVVTLDGTSDVTGVVLVVEKTATAVVAGMVLDTWGNPLEGVQVSASNPENLTAMSVGSEASARTNAEGKFAFSELKGGSFKLRASKPGYSPTTSDRIASGTQNVELRLAKHGQISGRIVTAAGAPPGPGGKVVARPLADVSLVESVQKLQSMLMGGQSEMAATARDDGSYTVEAPVGKVEVQVTLPGFAPGRSDPIEVVAGQEYHDVKIVVTAGAVARGRVTLGDGTAVEGAAVRVELKGGDETAAMLRRLIPQFYDTGTPTGSSNAEGFFAVEHLAEGEYLVSATHSKFAPSEAVTVALSRDQVSDTITLVLKRGGIITGAIVQGGAPKPAMMVQLMSGGSALEQRMTDASGSFRFENLGTGEYVLTIIDFAAMQKGKFCIKTRVVAVESEQTSDVEVEFGKGLKVFGKVKGYPAAPMRMLTLRKPGGPAPEDIKVMDIKASIESAKFQVGIGMVTQDDTYEITDVEPGTYILEAPRLPNDPTDMEAYAKMEKREPYYRKEITLKDADLELNIDIK